MGKIKMINGIIKLVINKDLFVILRLYVLEKQSLKLQFRFSDVLLEFFFNFELQRILKENSDIFFVIRDFFDFMVECRYDQVKKMFKERLVDVNFCDIDNCLFLIFLFIVIEFNDVEFVKLLLKVKFKFVNVNDENIKGRRFIW